MRPARLTLLDGAMGTALAVRGVDVTGPAWSAGAIFDQPDEVRALHRLYADAGAVVHTANTFRATPEALGDRFREGVRTAVSLARGAVHEGHRVAVSLAPSADCYEPRATPADARAHHRAMVSAFAETDADLVLCETFADPDEALVAVEESLVLGRPVWIALTGGPFGELLDPRELRRTAERAVAAGVEAVLVNCVAATLTLSYLVELRGLEVPLGVYANAGRAEDEAGYLVDFDRPTPDPAERRTLAERYAALADGWVREGATLIGGCCGTFPEHIGALRDRFGHESGPRRH